MTNAGIKKDLLFVAHYCHDEYNEIRVDVLLLNALDLINRQQAEIERLQNKVEELADVLSNSIRIRYAEAKSEAIKEFADRLKENCKVIGAPLITNRIDNLVKEMVGDAE